MIIFFKTNPIKFILFFLTFFQCAICLSETYTIPAQYNKIYDEDGTFTLTWDVNEFINPDARIELSWVNPVDFLNSNSDERTLSYWGVTPYATQKTFTNLPVGHHGFAIYYCYAGTDGWDPTIIDICEPIRQVEIVVGSSTTGEGMRSNVGGAKNGSAQIYIGKDGTFDRPVVVLQGYKPRDEIGSFDQWYNNLNSPEGGAMLDQLRNQGYDIVLYRYYDVNAGIAAAAAGLEVMLKRFNDPEFSRIRSVSLLGQSMGGVVARYALLQLQSLGIKTKVTTWISYDAPHLGAVVPPTLVDNLNRIYDKLDVYGCGSVAQCSIARSDIKSYLDDLNSGTASELLLNGPKSANNRNALNNTINSMGYFPKIPSLGVANGTQNIRQSNSETSVLLTSFDIYRNWPYKNADIDLWSNPSVENQPGGYENFYLTFNDKVSKFQNSLRQQVFRDQNHVFVTTASALGNLPFTKTITADANSLNEKHLQITKPKSDAIVSWLNSYQP